MKLIVNADDFGLCRGVNHAIIDCYKFGILTSTTLMVTMPSFLEAVNLMKENPGLGVGLHLNMTLGKPLTSCPSLVDEDGFFYKPKENPSQDKFNSEEIYTEFVAQYNLFLKNVSGTPTHIDSHLYAHQCYDKARVAAIRLASEVNIPLREFPINYYPKVEFLKTFKAAFCPLEELIARLVNDETILKYEYAELMVHPGYVDKFLLDNSSYALPRTTETAALLSPQVTKWVKEKKIELINYKHLGGKQNGRN